MQTGVHQQVSSTAPLGTISPQRVNTPADLSSTSPSQNEQDDQLEAEIRRQENLFIQKLQARDREVRAHEAAHLAAGRSYVTGGPSYTYQQGPDGRAYAIGGEVHLDTAKVPDDPDATLDKAETVRRAALAPASPSPQDLRVAADASQMAAQARLEIAIIRRQESQPSQNREQDTTATAGRNDQAIQSFTSRETPSTGFSQFA